MNFPLTENSSVLSPFYPRMNQSHLVCAKEQSSFGACKTWVGDHMENSAIVGIDQGLKGKPWVHTRPQALGVFVFSIV